MPVPKVCDPIVTVALGVFVVLHEIAEVQVLAPALMVQGFGEAEMVPEGVLQIALPLTLPDAWSIGIAAIPKKCTRQE